MKEEKIAEFIGIMIGDGSIGIYNCKAGNKTKIHRVVKITLDSRNKQYVSYVCNLMENVLSIKPTIRFKKDENAVDISTFRKEKILFVLNEVGLKISPKVNRMKIPKKYLSKKLAPLVLRGLFDTDGCLNIFNNNGRLYPRIEIKICPSPAQKQFLEILEKLKFKYRVQKLEKNWIRIRISGVKELKKWFCLVGSSNRIHIEKANRFIEKKVL